jgi:hypothetical protein
VLKRFFTEFQGSKTSRQVGVTPLSKGADATQSRGGILANGLISLPLPELALEEHPLDQADALDMLSLPPGRQAS